MSTVASTVRSSVAAAGLALLLAACGPVPAGAPAPGEVQSSPLAQPAPALPASTSPLETPARFPDASAAAVGEAPEALMQAIVADAAQRTGLEAGAFDVVRAEAVEWNDGSLGCPEPGMMYTQALVTGYHVVLAAEGAELDYRATDQGYFRLCSQT